MIKPQATGFDFFSLIWGTDFAKNGGEIKHASLNVCTFFSAEKDDPENATHRSLFAIGFEDNVFFIEIFYFLGFGLEIE